MPSEATPMLFAPPQPPFPLRDDASVVIGRASECDLRLPDADTSRRHAEIVCAGGRFVVRDLDSTNGTFVNGERVAEGCELRPGDRLQIGANTVTFCQVSRALEGSDDDGAQTTLFARPVAAEVFRGDLAEIPPFAVLQILEMGRKTGLLTIDAETEPGRLWLRGGEPVHAETQGLVGFDAAVRLVNAKLGRFTFEPQISLPDATIEASVTQLILEASRLSDEGLL